MIACVVIFAGCALAAQQPTQPYFMQKASSAMVNYAVKYRQTGVPESQASSAAAEVISSALAPSQATALVSSAVSYYAVNGPKVSGSQAAELVSKASSFYDEIVQKPAYTNFAKQVQEKQTLFDVSRAFDDAQARAIGIESRHNEQANKIASQVKATYNTLKADPAGSQAIQDGKQLAKRVGSDFNINTEAVKSKFSIAKDNFVTMLSGNSSR